MIIKPSSILSLLAVVGAVASASVFGDAIAAEATIVYVSASRDQKLHLYDLDAATGKLEHRAEVPLDGSPGAQCLNPDGSRLYVSVRSLKSVAAFRIDRETGALEHIRTSPIGSNAVYLATDRSGRWLLAASYSDGLVSSHRIKADGGVEAKPASVIETTRCAHAILPDAANRFVLVPHTCPNAVYQFRFDADTGRLTPNDPPRVEPASGLQPRHLAFHPDLDVVYFDDEKGSSVTAYHYDKTKGTLKPFQTVPTLPEGFSGSNSCADIEITADGRFVYASNRGHNSIVGFSIDAKDGTLTGIGQFATGETPRSFNLSPDNRWLVAAGQRSNDLTAYQRDPKSGSLKKIGVFPTGRGPAWVQIVQVGGKR